MSSLPADPDAAPSELAYRSGMLRRFGPLYWMSGLGVLLGRLRLSERSAERVRQAAERGPVVYVLHSTSLVDWLALNRVLNAHRLPLARFTTGLHSSAFAPLGEALRGAVAWLRERVARPPDPVSSGWLATAVARGMPTAIFVASDKGGPDPVAALVEAQARTSRPLQLVPVVVLWSRRPESQRTEIERVVLGSADEPGPLQKLLALLRREDRAIVEAGEPLDLRQLLERKRDETPARQVKTVRLVLRRFLYQTAHVIRGPRVRPFRWMRRLVLDSPEVRQLVADESVASGRPPEAVRDEVADILDHAAARMSYPLMQWVDPVVRFLWDRIYSGIDVRDEDLDRIREALRQGTPVLVPCHRSHLDYMLISSLLYSHDIVVPHVVAGDNLSFWPAGPLARRLGAVFIRRSFKGDRLFPVVFQRYLKQLLRDGFPVEFFIEGTRSRSGKLLPPKLGVLGMVLDAAAEGREGKETTLLPIAISYERIAEERAYARELGGEAKKKEDIAELARASKVVARRYGRVYLRVGEPIALRPVFAALPGPWAGLDRDHRREVLQAVGERLMYRIAQSMVVVPTSLVALALLSSARRGVRHLELFARCHRLLALLHREGATSSAALASEGYAVGQALRRFQAGKLISRIQDDEGDILRVFDERRVTLEYYKNGVLHFAVPASLLAGAVAARCVPSPENPTPAGRPDDAEVSRLFRLVVFLFRYEFTLNPDETIDALQARATRALLEYGALVERDGAISLGDPALLAELAGLTRNFVESYLLVLRGARTLRSRDIPPDDLPRRLLAVGRGLLAVDELRRPEALSIENLKNAVRAFREEGVLQVRVGGGGLQFEEGAHQQYMADLLSLLGRAPERTETA